MALCIFEQVPATGTDGAFLTRRNLYVIEMIEMT